MLNNIAESERLFYKDNHNWMFNGDARSMWELPDEFAQMVCTSPPYFGLRKYEGEQELIWDGDKECRHKWGSEVIRRDRGTAVGRTALINHEPRSGVETKQGYFCSLCGAWKGAFGLEPTPELYIQHTIEILREIRRVLRKDGVVFWNCGDSYAGGKGTCFNPGGGRGSFSTHGDRKDAGVYPLDRGNVSMLKAQGLKPLDMYLIPFHIAIEAQRDGWFARSVICWQKENPMPESVNGWRWERHKIKVKDRTKGTRLGATPPDSHHPGQVPHRDGSFGDKSNLTKWIDCPGCEKCLPNGGYVLRKGSWRPASSYEFILMLTKSPSYYCDAEAVREAQSSTTHSKGANPKTTAQFAAKSEQYNGKTSHKAWLEYTPETWLEGGRNLRDVWTFPTEPFGMEMCKGCGRVYDSASYGRLPIRDGKKECHCGASDWLSHFATFPEKLPELCIKAATSEKGCCPKCGKPWARVNEVVGQQVTEAMRIAGCDKEGRYKGLAQGDYESSLAQNPSESKRHILKSMSEVKQTLAWKATCDCGLEPIPCIVLDPFMGTGKTLWVAKKLGRRAVGYEISENYCRLALEMNRQGALIGT